MSNFKVNFVKLFAAGIKLRSGLLAQRPTAMAVMGLSPWPTGHRFWARGPALPGVQTEF